MLPLGFAAILFSAQVPPTEASPPLVPVATDVAPASLVDRMLCRQALQAGRSNAARAWVPSAATALADGQHVPASAVEAALAQGEALLTRKAWAPALVSFRRALVAQPGSARALWGISRAADGAGDHVLGRQAALRILRSPTPAADRSAELARAAEWRAEQPEEPHGPHR